jgi:DNA-binding MarR family transcriptional regulator
MHVQEMRGKDLKIQILRESGIMPRAMPQAVRDPALIDTWRELQARHARVTAALERALQKRHQLGVSEFEVLELLATTPGDHCRMHDLSGAVHLSQSALSRLVGRLEQDGLVERTMCSDDRRGIWAALTDSGRERYEQARPTQRAVLAEQLGDIGAAGR